MEELYDIDNPLPTLRSYIIEHSAHWVHSGSLSNMRKEWQELLLLEDEFARDIGKHIALSLLTDAGKVTHPSHNTDYSAEVACKIPVSA